MPDMNMYEKYDTAQDALESEGEKVNLEELNRYDFFWDNDGDLNQVVEHPDCETCSENTVSAVYWSTPNVMDSGFQPDLDRLSERGREGWVHWEPSEQPFYKVKTFEPPTDEEVAEAFASIEASYQAMLRNTIGSSRGSQDS